MISIAFANNKGGVGKTSSVQNVGAAIAKQGNKVLLVDLDPQASLTRAHGLKLQEIEKHVGDFILGDSSFQNTVLQSDLLDLLPATLDLRRKEVLIHSLATYQTKLKKGLKDLQYDYVLFDCPPAISTLTTLALVASDYYFVPLQAEFLSYEGLANLVDFANEIREDFSGCQLGGVYATRFNPKIRSTLRKEMVEAAKDSLKELYLENCFIRENVAISEAQALGENVFDYKPDSNGAEDYQRLTKTILQIVSKSIVK